VQHDTCPECSMSYVIPQRFCYLCGTCLYPSLLDEIEMRERDYEGNLWLSEQGLFGICSQMHHAMNAEMLKEDNAYPLAWCTRCGTRLY